MKRRWLYILIALGIVLFMIRSLRQQGGVPPGLEQRAEAYDAEIIRDRWGVPHIMGVTDADAAFGLGYAHSEDDFVTIQGALLAARGRLATILGREGAPNDYMVALLKVTEYAERSFAELDSATQALCNAYADGVNVYAAQNPRDAMKGLFPVTGTDVVAGFIHKTPLFFGLDGVLAQLFAESPEPDSTDVQGLERVTENATGTDVERTGGSNALAVAPSRSADGTTLLAVNSHQPWTGPVAWYEAHMMSKEGLNMLGGTFPGSPVILHGHNADLGWAHTVNQPDMIDLFELRVNPDNRDEYWLDGAWKAFESGEASMPIQVVGLLKWTFNRELLWSVHGPVVRTDSGAVAVRFPGWGDGRQVQQWYRMNKAEGLEEWTEALSMRAVPVFNAVYADRRGHIYYVYNARLPRRIAGQDWSGVVSGDSSALIWDETIPFEELPQVLDPAIGFVQNANSSPFETTGTDADPLAARAPVGSGIETHLTNRASRALTLLGGDESITWEEFKSYKYDMRFGPESRAAALLRQVRFAISNDSLTAKAMEVLERWDLGTEPGNRQAALGVLSFRPWLDRYEGVTTTTQLLARVRAAADFLIKHHGTLEPAWEEVNRLRRGSVDLGLGGGPDILHAVYGTPTADGRIEGYQGDSYVLLVEFGPDGPIRSESVHVFGSATSDAESPHYADQAPLFVRRELKSMPFTEAAVRAAAIRTYRPGR